MRGVVVVVVKTALFFLLMFLGCGGSGNGSDEAVPSAPRCSSLLATTPRGFSCLHASHPNAGPSCDSIVTMLEDSCLERPAINFLESGHFGHNDIALLTYITRLNADGRKPVIEYYLVNGSAQRRCDDGESAGTLDNLCGKDFGNRLQNSPSTKEKFLGLYSRLFPLFRANTSGENFVSPVLEDDISDAAFETAVNMLRAATPADISVRFIRNPNGSKKVPAGVNLEAHTEAPVTSFRNGVVTNDGDVFYWLSDQASDSLLSLYDMDEARDRASTQNNVFILWCAECQGRQKIGNRLGPSLPVNSRNYHVLTEAQKMEAILFLRGDQPL